MLCPGSDHHTGVDLLLDLLLDMLRTFAAHVPPEPAPSRWCSASVRGRDVRSGGVDPGPGWGLRLAALAYRDAARAASAGAQVGQIPAQWTDTGCFLIAQIFAARNTMIRVSDEDGLFAADPKQHPNAEIILRISVQELVRLDTNDLVVERAVL
jgi:hypothetical protein